MTMMYGRVDPKPACVKIARRSLGEAADLPLVQAMLKWIDKDDLWMALEEAGLVVAGKGTLVTVQEVVKEVNALMEAQVEENG